MLNDIVPKAPYRESQSVSVPRTSRWLVWLFSRYVFRYMRRSFHAVRVARAGKPESLPDVPIIAYINHPSWWDPLFCIVLAKKLFPERTHYAPMDLGALKRYKFFQRLGFFGVVPKSSRGARSLLTIGEAILKHNHSMLWITPQGCFADTRERPVSFRPGLGYLVHHAGCCALLPIALEYPFWEERFPEALARCGTVVSKDKADKTSFKEWTLRLQQQLESVQNDLAADSLRRNRAAFDVLLSGRAGVGGPYDMWRAIKAKLRGDTFRAEHGEYGP